MDRNDLLASSPVFAGLDAALLARAAAGLQSRRYDRGTAVYLRGDAALAFYGVAEGRVRFGAGSPDGKEVVLDYAAAGEWFGEIGLFDDGPRVVDAFAAEPTQLYVLARRDLMALCRAEPELLLRFVALFSRRIRVAEDIIVDASFLGLPARLAKKILALAADPGRSEPTARGAAVRISQDELGRLAAVTRESAGRQLKAWERDGLVALEYGRVVVLDPARLRRVVSAAMGE